MVGIKIKSEKAFTLVELICVITLLGIIILIAAPALSGRASGRDLELTARTMAMDMRKSQQKAITTGWTQIIEFRRSAGDYVLIDGKTSERVIVKLPEGIRYVTINFPETNRVPRLFFRYTGAPNQGGTVSLENEKDDMYYIIVAPATGRVRISQTPPESW